jgi:hypothetical protein
MKNSNDTIRNRTRDLLVLDIYWNIFKTHRPINVKRTRSDLHRHWNVWGSTSFREEVSIEGTAVAVKRQDAMTGWQYDRGDGVTLEIRNSVIIVVSGMPLSCLIWIRVHFQCAEIASLDGCISVVYWSHCLNQADDWKIDKIRVSVTSRCFRVTIFVVEKQ